MFLIFKCVRKVGEIVFGIRFLFPYFYIDPGTGEIDSTNLFLNQISAIKLRASFYTLKSNILSFFCCETAKNMERVAATPCVFHFLISFPNLGVFYCKENSLILMFSKLVFNGFSWAINGLIHSFMYISISHSIWVCVKIHFLLMWIQEETKIELGADSKCAPEDEGEKLKVKVLVK